MAGVELNPYQSPQNVSVTSKGVRRFSLIRVLVTLAAVVLTVAAIAYVGWAYWIVDSIDRGIHPERHLPKS